MGKLYEAGFKINYLINKFLNAVGLHSLRGYNFNLFVVLV